MCVCECVCFCFSHHILKFDALTKREAILINHTTKQTTANHRFTLQHTITSRSSIVIKNGGSAEFGKPFLQRSSGERSTCECCAPESSGPGVSGVWGGGLVIWGAGLAGAH